MHKFQVQKAVASLRTARVFLQHVWATRKTVVVLVAILLAWGGAVIWVMRHGYTAAQAALITLLNAGIVLELSLLALPGLMIHEFGHWLMAKAFGCTAGFRLTWLGPAVTHNAAELGLPLWKRTLITAAGPGAAALFAGLLRLTGASNLTAGSVPVGELIVMFAFWGSCVAQLIWPDSRADGWRIVVNLHRMWRAWRHGDAGGQVS